MKSNDLYKRLLSCQTVKQFEILLDAFIDKNESNVSWKPVGDWNNSGVIGVSADPGRALIERVTNAMDAILEYEHFSHKGLPDCRSPKEAASAWLAVPEEGLSGLTSAKRRELAQKVQVILEEGSGKDKRVVEVRDYGIGIASNDMKNTILSLNKSNKMQKHYLAGTYGQGGSSTFAVSQYTLIASKHKDSASVGFTIVKYDDLFQFEDDEKIFQYGTQVRHYGFDLHSYAYAFGPNSVYGLLNEMLFDPVMPIWLDNKIYDWRRTIKGSCTALSGAVDSEDETKAPTLSHHIPSFYVPLGSENGGVMMQYWLLAPSDKKSTTPTASFVNDKKPIVLTLNGQNHAELPVSIIKKNAELPYLARRLIVHIDCNRLSPEAKRALFVSTREEVRKGMVRDLIEEEVINALKADDDLIRLNTEAYAEVINEEDESAKKEMRDEVARLLKIQGMEIAGSTGAEATDEEGDTTERITHPRKGRRKPKPIELHEPPTYIKILRDEEKAIRFYPSQSRYIRIETDAQSQYHDHKKPEASRINVMVMGEGLAKEVATTPLKGGRMRVIFKCLKSIEIGVKGNIRVELTRPGLPVLFDECGYEVVKPPEAKKSQRKITLPPFKCIPVDPDSSLWIETLSWPDDSTKVASEAIFANGELIIYFSTVFPRYFDQMTFFERRDPMQAKSFTERYKIWIAVHSLFIFEAQQNSDDRSNGIEEVAEERSKWECEERCRSAALAVLFATREVKSGLIVNDDA